MSEGGEEGRREGGKEGGRGALGVSGEVQGHTAALLQQQLQLTKDAVAKSKGSPTALLWPGEASLVAAAAGKHHGSVREAPYLLPEGARSASEKHLLQ